MTPAMAASLSFQDVAVTAGADRDRVVLDLPQLAVARGEVTAVVGENGAGKTTLLHAAAGLIDLARGEVLLDGERFHRGRAPAPQRLRHKTALVLQEPLLLSRRVEAAVGFGLRVRGVPRAERIERTRAVQQRLGLTQLAGRSPAALSGGERRLAAFAAAVVVQPSVLLLDEVTSGLDGATIERVAREIEELCARQATILITTHQADHVRDLAHRTIALRAGRLAD